MHTMSQRDPRTTSHKPREAGSQETVVPSDLSASQGKCLSEKTHYILHFRSSLWIHTPCLQGTGTIPGAGASTTGTLSLGVPGPPGVSALSFPVAAQLGAP